MKLSKIAEIHNALAAIGKNPLTIAYQIAKNMSRTRRLVEEGQEQVLTLQKAFAAVDTNGNPVWQEMKRKDGSVVRQVVEGVGPVPLRELQFKGESEEEVEKNRFEYEAAVKKIEEEDHKIEFHAIKESAIEQLQLPAVALEPLIGTVILPDADVQGHPKAKKTKSTVH